MNLYKALFIVVCFFCKLLCFAQKIEGYKSFDPADNNNVSLNGQGWHNGLKSHYDRFPAYAETKVRTDVWNLSRHSTGLNFCFETDASDIIIRYVSYGDQQLPAMPATAVRGLDLYTNINNQWNWCAGKFTFKDTSQYVYAGLNTEKSTKKKRYKLFLPLFNSLAWIKIYIPEKNSFVLLAAEQEKPIVVYGTSIAQGIAASRPGMAWPTILHRQLKIPFINLAFSGNGRLETSVINLIAEIEAEIYILDCLPNLTGDDITSQQLVDIIKNAVITLREKRPQTPIILTEHPGYIDEKTNTGRLKEYLKVNDACKKAFTGLLKKYPHGLYLLTKKDIDLDDDCGVDWSHPSDLGMTRYASAYKKIITAILSQKNRNEKTGEE